VGASSSHQGDAGGGGGGGEWEWWRGGGAGETVGDPPRPITPASHDSLYVSGWQQGVLQHGVLSMHL
jgi:hypothetical protein